MANESPTITATSFGDLLKRLRKRAGMTQEDLAAATGYSPSLIGALEANRRLPDVAVITQTYLPALDLQDEPLLAAQLVELAARARGERPPSSLTLLRERPPPTGQEEHEEGHCIPVPPTGILGRDEEIHHLCNRLLGHRGRLLTLVGPPGVGKTRLAQAVGIELQRFYRDGACLVSLAAISNPALVASTLLSALRVYGGSAKSSQSRLIEHLRRKEILLVLDNFEQLLGGDAAAVELVAALLAECPGLCLLVTSRERLHLRAEQRYRVEPLSLPAAVDLFVERCQAVDPGFTLTAANRPIIEAICQSLDRLPLALELCAAQIDLFSPAQLLAHLPPTLPAAMQSVSGGRPAHEIPASDTRPAGLPPSRFAATEDASGGRPAHAIPESEARPAGLRDRRFELLVGGAHDLPPRQRSLHAAIAHSYNLLDEGERHLFRSLGVFVGGCDLEAIEAISGWDPEMAGRPLPTALHALVGKSLVHAETAPDGVGRYLLLETIREFAWGQARAEGEEELLRQRHYAVTLQLFRTGDAQLRGLEATAWAARLQPEQDNLRAALDWALGGKRYEDAAWLMLAAAWFWFYTGRWQESIRWISQLLPHREALSAAQRLALLIDLYRVARASLELQPFGPYLDEMLDLLEVCQDKALQAVAWNFIAGGSATNLAEASAMWERSIASGRAAHQEGGLGPEFGVVTDRDYVLATPLWAYADILTENGELERAASLLAESARLFEARGTRYRVADVLGTQGRLALLQGDIERAYALLREAVTLGQALNYRLVLGTVQSVLGLVTLYRGDLPEARRLLADSFRICLDLGDWWFLGRVTTYLAETALWEGDLDAARHWLAQGLPYKANRPLIRMDHMDRVMVAARLAAAQGAYLRAATLFGAAEKMRSEMHYELAGPARQLADAALATVRGALDPAAFAEAFAAGRQLSLEEALATALALGSASGAPSSLPQPSA